MAETVVTFMGAHALPEGSDRRTYVLDVIDMLPEVRELADFCDVFCEEGAFTVDESRKVLEAAMKEGFGLKIHADEFGDTGGGQLAAELGVISADHLAGSTTETFVALKEAGTIGVLLPGTPFAMQLVQQLAVFRMNMTPSEALVASTINSAFAIGKTDRGCIAKGWRADLIICDIPDYRHLTYHFGKNHVESVIVGGKILDV